MDMKLMKLESVLKLNNIIIKNYNLYYHIFNNKNKKQIINLKCSFI